MLYLIPKPVHRAGLRLAYRVRHHFRKVFRLPIRGVSVVVRDAQGKVLLVRHSYGSELWSLPGGGLKRTEPPELAARREIREELGIEVMGLDLLHTLDETISGAPHVAFVFAATIDALPSADGREIREARFFALDALPPELSRLTLARLEIWKEHLVRSGVA